MKYLSSYRGAKIGLLLGLLALFFRWLLTPQLIEQYYSRGFFLLIRTIIDTLVGSWLPIASLYVLLVWLLWRLVANIRTWWGQRGAGRWWSLAWGILGFLGYTIFLFLILWGYNYGRIPVQKTLALPTEKLSLSELQEVVQAEAKVLTDLRNNITMDTSTLSNVVFPDGMEAVLREGLESALLRYGYPATGKMRARLVYPKGIFLRFSSAGLYFPWTGEGHVDAGLIPLQRPYTMVHELAHGYGFGDEGTCSFWAYLTAFEIQQPIWQYTIRLGYWRRIAIAWVRADQASYDVFRASLHPGIIADLNAINENITAYPDIMPRFRYVAYDTYLKAQGIQEGMLNYGTVVRLVEAWRKKFK